MEKPKDSLDVNRTQLIGMLAALRGVLIEFTNPNGGMGVIEGWVKDGDGGQRPWVHAPRPDADQIEALVEAVRQGRELLELTGFALASAEEVNGGFDKSWHFEDSPETKPDDLAAARKRIVDLEMEVAALESVVQVRDSNAARLSLADKAYLAAHKRGLDGQTEFDADPNLVTLREWQWRGLHAGRAQREANLLQAQLLASEKETWRDRRALIALRAKCKKLAEFLHTQGAVTPAELVHGLAQVSTEELVQGYESQMKMQTVVPYRAPTVAERYGCHDPD